MTTKKNNNDIKTDQHKYEWVSLALIIIIVLIVEWIGNYCNEHAEERRQKDWEHFEQRMDQIHYMKWD